MAEHICPHCGQPYPPSRADDDVLAIVPPDQEPLGTPAEAACDPGDEADIIVWSGTPPVFVEDEILDD